LSVDIRFEQELLRDERPSESLNPIREYAGTLATQFLVLSCQILVYKFAARFLGTVGFSEYAVSRRTISLLQPVALLGIGVGLPRYIAMAEAAGDFGRVKRFFGSAIWCVCFAVAVIASLLIVWKDWFSYLFFGTRQYGELVPALSVMLIGLSAHGLAYAFLRGRMAISRANVLNLLNLGIVPLVVLFWFNKSVAFVLWSLAFGWTAVALGALVQLPVAAATKNHSSERRELIRYSLQRVPGDFVMTALISLPAIFAAHASGIQLAGYVAFGVSIVNMIAAMFAPVGVVLLPKISRNLMAGLSASMRGEIRLIGWLAALISFAIIVVLEVLAPLFIRAFLGGAFEPAVGTVRILAIAALPLALYSALRSVIDGFHERAVNTINLFISFLAFLGLSALWLLDRSSPDIILVSFVAAISLLSVLTVSEVGRVLRHKFVLKPGGGS
jgi:O-antigen/teichoic acid export membrane protein